MLNVLGPLGSNGWFRGSNESEATLCCERAERFEAFSTVRGETLPCDVACVWRLAASLRPR